MLVSLWLLLHFAGSIHTTFFIWLWLSWIRPPFSCLSGITKSGLSTWHKAMFQQTIQSFICVLCIFISLHHTNMTKGKLTQAKPFIYVTKWLCIKSSGCDRVLVSADYFDLFHLGMSVLSALMLCSLLA